MVDERKRERFEMRCHRLDAHAMFRYKGSWEVRYSKCSRWVMMQEPYSLVRFRGHINGCKHARAPTCNGTIDLFFKQ